MSPAVALEPFQQPRLAAEVSRRGAMKLAGDGRRRGNAKQRWRRAWTCSRSQPRALQWNCAHARERALAEQQRRERERVRRRKKEAYAGRRTRGPPMWLIR